MSDQWLSIVEYARTYNVSDMTVRRRIKTGKLQAVLRDGKYYIPTSEFSSTQPDVEPPKPAAQRALVKQRPSAKVEKPITKTPVAPKARSQATSDRFHIPEQIRNNLDAYSNSMVETSTLLAFCENALDKVSETETRLDQNYQAKIAQLESQVRAKDLEIKQLCQQVEDLQVLVKILERKQTRPD